MVDFVVGRVLSHNGGTEGASGLDDVTTYYLLHRHDFGFEDVPAGACILYAEGRPAPIIDQVHRLMHLWKTGDVVKMDEYLDARGLCRHRLFQQLLQALIELASPGSDETLSPGEHQQPRRCTGHRTGKTTGTFRRSIEVNGEL